MMTQTKYCKSTIDTLEFAQSVSSTASATACQTESKGGGMVRTKKRRRKLSNIKKIYLKTKKNK